MYIPIGLLWFLFFFFFGESIFDGILDIISLLFTKKPEKINTYGCNFHEMEKYKGLGKHIKDNIKEEIKTK